MFKIYNKHPFIYLLTFIALLPFASYAQSYKVSYLQNPKVTVNDPAYPIIQSRDLAHILAYDTQFSPFIILNAFRSTESIQYLPSEFTNFKILDLSSNGTIFLTDKQPD